MNVSTVVPCIGSRKGQRETGAVTLTRYSRCAATKERSNYRPWNSHPKNSPTFSRQQHHKPIASANIFANTTQLSRLHRLGLSNTVNEGGGGPPTFRIHGELRHQLGSLLPRHGERPVYAQLYIYDPHEALQHRMQPNATLDPIIMKRLQALILRYHRWARIFKHAAEVFEERDCENASIQLTANQNHDRRRWNLPSVDEVAVVVPGDGTQPCGHREIVVYRRDGPFRRISDGSPMYECLQYPFLFIRGEDGYHYNLQTSPSKENRLSPTDHVAYRIQHRPDEFSLLLRSGRPFQQYLVDL